MRDPYRKSQANLATQDPRAIERDLLMRITRAMESASEQQDRIALIEAITDNQSIWTIFVSDASGSGNKLPLELRGAIVSVGMAVIKEMNDNPTDPDIPFLVEINRNIIEGLSAQPARQAPTARPPMTGMTGVSA